MNIFDYYMKCLLDLATVYPIVLIDCDLGKTFKSELFKERYPNRYFNVGIAEQNAVSMAAALSASGFYPVVQSFSSFISTRACDQIRSSVCFPKLKVILVGAKAGLSDNFGGAVHQSIDDIGIISSIPNIDVISPSNSYDLHMGLDYALKNNGPSYIRIESNIPVIADQINKNITRKYDTHDLCLLSTGYVTNICESVTQKLLESGYQVLLKNVVKLKPLERDIGKILHEERKIMVVETHNKVNGLGANICRIAFGSRANKHTDIKVVAINDKFMESGETKDLEADNNLSEELILNLALDFLNEKGYTTNGASSFT